MPPTAHFLAVGTALLAAIAASHPASNTANDAVRAASVEPSTAPFAELADPTLKPQPSAEYGESISFPQPLPSFPLVLPATPPPARPPRLPVNPAGVVSTSADVYLRVNFSWPLPPRTRAENPFRADLDTAVTLGLSDGLSDAPTFGPACGHTWTTPRGDAAFSGDDVFAPGWEAYLLKVTRPHNNSVLPVRLSASWFVLAPQEALRTPIDITVALELPGFAGVSTKRIRTFTHKTGDVCPAWYRNVGTVGHDVAVVNVRFDDGLAALEILDLNDTITPEPSPMPFEMDAEGTDFDSPLEPSAELVEDGPEFTGEEETGDEGTGLDSTAEPFPADPFVDSAFPSDPAVLVSFAGGERGRTLLTGVYGGGEGYGGCGSGAGIGFGGPGPSRLSQSTTAAGERYTVSLGGLASAVGPLLEIHLFARWDGGAHFSGGLANVTVEVRGAGGTADVSDDHTLVRNTVTFNPVAEPGGRAGEEIAFCIFNKIGKVRVVRRPDMTIVAKTFLYARTERVH